MNASSNTPNSIFAQANNQRVARDTEEFDGARQCEGIGRDDADVGVHVDKAVRVEGLRVHDGRIDKVRRWVEVPSPSLAAADQ